MLFKGVQRMLGFPGGASGEEPICQWRRHQRHGFDPWVGEIPWRRAWQHTPVFLPGESHRQRSLVASQRVRHDWSDLPCTSTHILDRHTNLIVQMGGWALLIPVLHLPAVEVGNHSLAMDMNSRWAEWTSHSFMKVPKFSKAWAKHHWGHSGFCGLCIHNLKENSSIYPVCPLKVQEGFILQIFTQQNHYF